VFRSPTAATHLHELSAGHRASGDCSSWLRPRTRCADQVAWPLGSGVGSMLVGAVALVRGIATKVVVVPKPRLAALAFPWAGFVMIARSVVPQLRAAAGAVAASGGRSGGERRALWRRAASAVAASGGRCGGGGDVAEWRRAWR
jgi:hypothetical protein